MPLVLKRHSLFSKIKRSHRERERKRDGGPERGAATKARGIVSDKPRKPRDHRYHNVRATYRMTREAPRNTESPGTDPSDPRCFCAGLFVESRAPLGSPRSQTAKHADTVRYTRGGPAVTKFTDVVPPGFRNAKRDTRAGERRRRRRRFSTSVPLAEVPQGTKGDVPLKIKIRT